MKRIVFICHGNICRSPMAEYIAKSLSDDIVVESMAVSREELGNSIYPRAAETLRRHHIPYSRHAARQITKADYDRFDYLVVMEEYNITRLMHIIGGDPDNKVHRLLDFTDTPGDIEDPWYSGNFERVYQQIKQGCIALLDYIKKAEE